MAIAYVAGSLASYASGSTQTQTVSVDPGTGTNRFVIALAYHMVPHANDITGCTYNGVSMTGGTQFTANSNIKARVFYLAGDEYIASGAHNVQATQTNGDISFGLVACAFYGVDPTTPVSHETNGGTGGTNINLTVTSTTGELAIVIGTCNSTPGALSATSPTVLDGDGVTGNYTNNRGYIMHRDGAASPVNVAATTGTTEYWVAGYSLKPATGGGVQTTDYYPGADADNSGVWTTDAGSSLNLYQALDEGGTPNDSDYVQSPLSPTNKSYTVQFANVAAPAAGGATTDYVISYHAWGDGTTKLTVDLLGGNNTVIKTWYHDPLDTDAGHAYTHNDLSSGEIAAWVTAGFPNSKLKFTADPAS